MAADTRPATRLRWLARLVPASDRTAWVDEWTGELAHDPSFRTLLAATEDGARLRVRSVRHTGIASDLRATGRSLARSPAWTLAVVLTLALGLGSTTAMFTVVYGIVLRPLPFAEPDRLLAFDRQMTYPLYTQIAERQTALDPIGAWADASLPVRIDQQAEPITSAFINADLLPTLGATPLLGRATRPADDEEGAAGAVMLSHGLWMDRFGGDPQVIGRTLEIGERLSEIVGVMPASFAFPTPRTRLWLSMKGAPRSQTTWYLNLVGRVQDGVPVAEARLRLTGIELDDRSADDGTVEILATRMPVTLQGRLRGDVAPILLFQGAVVALLLIACVNVTNLLTSRALTRQRELAVRSALGASRLQLVRFVLIESVLLALAGGLVGLTVAVALVRFLPTITRLPLQEQIALDWPVLGMAAALSMLVGVLVGAVPALRANGFGAGVGLAMGSRAGTDSGRRHRLRRVLVASQVALALALIAAGGLLAREFVRLATTDPGFDTDGITIVSVAPPEARYADQPAKMAFYDELIQQLQALPGVTDVATSGSVPLTGAYSDGTVEIEGLTSSGAGPADAEVHTVGTGYFATLGIPVVSGRDFSRDEPDPYVVVINETFAARYFPDGDAVGRRLRGFWSLEEHWMTVVGVVGDVRHRSLGRPMDNQAYLPYATATWPWAMHVLMRTGDADMGALSGPVRAVVGAVDPGGPAVTLGRLSDIRYRSIADTRVSAMLLGVFAAASFLLAIVGTYGVVSESVNRRRREFGIRLALGADGRRVTRDVIRAATLTTAIGIGAGLILTMVTMSWLGSLVPGLPPSDPTVLASASAALLLASVAAAALPALRASRFDPLESLRQE